MTTPQIADKLNELIGLDSKCIDALIQHQTPCNVSLRNHPEISINTYSNPDATRYFVSCLSIINALSSDNKVLIADYNEQNDIIHISVIEKSQIVA